MKQGCRLPRGGRKEVKVYVSQQERRPIGNSGSVPAVHKETGLPRPRKSDATKGCEWRPDGDRAPPAVQHAIKISCMVVSQIPRFGTGVE